MSTIQFTQIIPHLFVFSILGAAFLAFCFWEMRVELKRNYRQKKQQADAKAERNADYVHTIIPK